MKKLVNGVEVEMSSEEAAAFSASRIRITRAQMASDIIALCDAIYAAPMRYSMEYELREAQALAYKAAVDASAEELPAAPMVQDFADAKGITLAAAVALTLAQAAALRGAVPQVGKWRMQKTYVVREDVTDEQALARYATTMSALRAIQAAVA